MHTPAIQTATALAAPPFGRSLTKRQKAAIVMRLLRAEGVELSLATLPDDLQLTLGEAMRALRYIDHTTLQSVIAEFVAELEAIGLSFPRDDDGVLGVLEGALSDTAAARLRARAGLGMAKDPWDRIAQFDVARLLPILEEESIEVGAIMLSKLKVSKSAEILGMLPGERARRITYAVSQTGAIAPTIVATIGAALVGQLDAQAPSAFETGPVERVGAILNFSRSEEHTSELQSR